MMQSEKPSLVFFGSGPVAAESLRLLLHEFQIEAIITKITTLTEMKKIVNTIVFWEISEN